MPVLFVILDGAADRSNPELGNLSPLQSANMPNLSNMALKSAKGMMYPIAKGIAPESDAAVFSILGYDVASYTGRGPLESYGAGLKIDGKCIAFRCNFATVDNRKNIIDRRAGRIETLDANALEKEVNSIELGIKGITFKFKSTVGHRGVCVFYTKKDDLSSNVSNADIGYVKRGNISVAVEVKSKELPTVVALDSSPQAMRTAVIVNTFVDKVIEKLSLSKINIKRRESGLLQANAVLLRDGGKGLPKVVKFEKKNKMKCAFIAEMPVEMGIARLLGMKPIKLRQIKDAKKRYAKMAQFVNKNIKKYDFIYVHIKGPDEPGHDGNAKLKKYILEDIDTSFFSKIDGIEANVCVTCDHATPCPIKAHSDDPVPVMIKYMDGHGADTLRFDEKIGNMGSIGTINGNMLIGTIIAGMKHGK